MSKLLRLPFTLLAVLAALVMLPGAASADGPSAAYCAAQPNRVACQQPTADNATTEGGTTAASPLSAVVPDQVQGALVAPALTTPTVPNCDALPSTPLGPCELPNCIPDGTAPPAVDPPAACLPAPPACVPTDGLPGLCQVPCPPSTTTTTAAAPDSCTPPITCDQFAKLFGFGDNCSDIPMCIPQDKVPPGFPIPIPSPPLCGPGAGGTPPPPTTHPGQGTYMPPTQPAAQQQTGPYYANCTDAHAQGVSNIPKGSPGYRPELDSDSDGIACEADTTQPVTQTTQPTGTLAYTGMELGPQLNLVWTLLVLGSGLLIVGRRSA